MPSAVAELNNIPFGTLIGSPMRAAIQAQALAARTTVEFIQEVGFIPQSTDPFADPSGNPDLKDVRNVTFSYEKTDADGNKDDFELTVPVLTIVPIPFLRITEMSIDFTAKLTDAIQHTNSNSTTLSGSVKGNVGSFFSPVKVEFRSSVAYENKNTSSSKFIRDYKMDINVKAAQDDMPAGLARVLKILETAITEQPKS